MKNNAGMSLVEVIIAMAIVFIIFLGLSNSGLLVLDQNIKNSQRDEAVAVADNVMQQARNALFNGLGNSSDNVFRKIRGINQLYRVTRTVATIDPTNKQVTVNVEWDRLEYGQSRTYSHRIDTIVRQR